MTKQQTIERLEKELYEWKNYANDLKDRHDLALNSLSELAQGFGVKGDYSWQSAMQKLAGNAIVAIGNKRLRKAY
ncbi:hypothetical protein [Dyadobacter sp. CY356]|uniref:hypothetical protein n=1 Tax=Dyadobacter sp. CY356 TaxID=2906442 RepID=UPI001F17A67D|nr:hypothetical protein [Dyadobacter sp. CY356]MCF0055556.1 hypothetical protein [Dyadobacter sp. CY356]